MERALRRAISAVLEPPRADFTGESDLIWAWRPWKPKWEMAAEQTKRGVERDRIKGVFLPTGKSFRRNSDPAVPEKGKRYPRSQVQGHVEGYRLNSLQWKCQGLDVPRASRVDATRR